jgi:Tol biopolymer transport system component
VIGAAVGATAGIAAWSLRPKVALVPGAVPLTSYRGSEDIPSFSPDGNAVAFHWDGEKQDNWDIYVKALGADSTPIRLTTDPAPDVVPAWSPDGRMIAFLRRTGIDHFNLMLIPALGGPARKLAEFKFRTMFNGFNPAWSADSRWLVVSSVVGDGASLFRVSAETGEVSQIVNQGPTAWDQWPAISPDGRTLLFTRRKGYPARAATSIKCESTTISGRQSSQGGFRSDR